MAKTTKKKEVEAVEAKLITIDDFNVNALAEIQGKREQQMQLVKDNPYVEITDNTSWEVAKKARTALRSGRTGLTAEEKAVLAKVKSVITDPVKTVYKELIAITEEAETKQQIEVKRYDDIKENERIERERVEEERKATHRNNINEFFSVNNAAIQNLDYETSKTFELEPKIAGEVVNPEAFEEFEELYESKLEVLKTQLSEKVRMLQQKEDLKVEQARLAKEKQDREREEGIKRNIDLFYETAHGLISNLELKNIENAEKMFDSSKSSDYFEFAPLFEDKVTSLKSQLAEKIKFLKAKEEMRKDREEIALQKKENLIASRKNELKALGFDDKLQYIGNKITLLLPIDFIEKSEDDKWNNWVKEIKLSIEKDNITEPEPIIEEVVEEIIQPTEAVEEIEVTEEVDEIQDVDYEEISEEPEPTRIELRALLITFAEESDYLTLHNACIKLGLLNEKE